MVTLSVKQCDHCQIDDSHGGVGKGNVNAVSVLVNRAGGSSEQERKANHLEADLCCDCEKELRDAITRWMSPRVKQ